MASIQVERLVGVPAETAWKELRQPEAAPRLFAGVLVEGDMEGDVRRVVFADGLEVRERIVTVDDASRRLVYTVLGGHFEHHSAAMQILPDGEDACRFVWISDFLPDEHAAMVGPLMDAGAEAFGRNVGAASV